VFGFGQHHDALEVLVVQQPVRNAVCCDEQRERLVYLLRHLVVLAPDVLRSAHQRLRQRMEHHTLLSLPTPHYGIRNAAFQHLRTALGIHGSTLK
jgi:hypothetical protein